MGLEKNCCPGLFNLRFFTPPCSIVSSADVWDSDLSECLFFAYCWTLLFSDSTDLLVSVVPESSDGVSTTALFKVKVEFRESIV